MPAKSSKRLYVAAMVLFLTCVGGLAFLGFSENSVYFLNVSEALAMPADKLQSARLFGTVKAEGIDMAEQGKGVSFLLEDKDDTGKTLLVVYRGQVPDTFKAGAEVIVEGGFAADQSRFEAGTLMTKCPSKYQKENRT